MLSGNELVVTGIAYTVATFVAGFFVGKRNGEKATQEYQTVKATLSQAGGSLETRVSALENAVLSGLKIKLGEAQADLTTATSAVKAAVEEAKKMV